MFDILLTVLLTNISDAGHWNSRRIETALVCRLFRHSKPVPYDELPLLSVTVEWHAFRVTLSALLSLRDVVLWIQAEN